MDEEDSLAGRLKEARFATAAKLRETVSQERMAELVSEELGRVLHATQWRRYESGEREAPLEVISAAARVGGLPQAYVAFGSRPEIPWPSTSAPEKSRQVAESSAPTARGYKRVSSKDLEGDAKKRKRKGA